MDKIYKIERDSNTYLDSIENDSGKWLGATFPSDNEIEKLSFRVEVKRGKTPTHDLLGSFSNEIVISNRFKELICKLSLPEFVRFIPVTVLHKGTSVREKYFALHEYHRYLDVADLDLSIPEYAGKVLVHYTKFVVSSDKCPEFDFFPAEPAQWLASEEVLRLAIQHKLTGLVFREILKK